MADRFKLWHEVTTAEGVRAALDDGRFASLFAAGLSALAVLVAVAGGSIEGPGGQPVGQDTASLTGMALESVFFVWCAWRFHGGQGAFVGIAAIIVFALEVAFKIIGGQTNGGFVVMFAAVLVGMVNGTRGAWAVRKGGVPAVQ